MHRYLREIVTVLLLSAMGWTAAADTAAPQAKSLLSGYYGYRMGVFTAVPLGTHDIVMLGDSLTEGGEWSELFPGLPLRDRGIGGDTAAGVLARLESITAAKPAAIFLLVGTNDLVGPREIDASLATYHEILVRIRRETPGTRVFVQSLLPRSSDYRERVEAYNRALAGFCREMGLTYVDLYPSFLGADGALRPELTFEGLHLNGAGYRLWQSLLAPYLKELHE
jgi:hypothetical protein